MSAVVYEAPREKPERRIGYADRDRRRGDDHRYLDGRSEPRGGDCEAQGNERYRYRHRDL